MRPDYDSLADGVRRDLELGAALAALPQPGLPDDVDARLRAAVEEERRRNRRRPGWPELIALLILAAVIAAPFAWRSLPPAASTMDAVLAAVDTRRANVIPTPPEAAIVRGRMTADEREALESRVKASIVATCTPRFALEQLVDHPHLARNAARASARRLAEGAVWPAPAAEMPAGDPVFVRRNWDGSIVIGFGEDEEIGDLYVFRRVDGRWLIDEVVHRGA